MMHPSLANAPCNIIAGEPVPIPGSGLASVNPAHPDRVIWEGSPSTGGAADAVDAARRAFPEWSRLPVEKRIEALRDRRCVAAAAGHCHSLVVSDSGRVHSFGAGAALGHEDCQPRHKPVIVRALRPRRVVAVAAGDCNSLVLTDDGVALSFGCGKHGRLGHGAPAI